MLARRTIGFLLTGTLLAAACGGGGPDEEADREASERAIAAFEDALEERGFEAAPDDDEEDSDIEFESEDCEDFAEAFPSDDEDLPGETASAESADFERGQLDLQGGVQEGAQGGIGFIEDEDEAAEFFELVGDDRLGDCLVEAVEIEFAEQAEQDDLDVTLGEVAIDQGELGVGDDDVDLTISTSIQVQDFTFPVAFEFALARSGRTAAFVGLFAIGGDAIGEDAGDLLTLLLEEAGAESG